MNFFKFTKSYNHAGVYDKFFRETWKSMFGEEMSAAIYSAR